MSMYLVRLLNFICNAVFSHDKIVNDFEKNLTFSDGLLWIYLANFNSNFNGFCISCIIFTERGNGLSKVASHLVAARSH